MVKDKTTDYSSLFSKDTTTTTIATAVANQYEIITSYNNNQTQQQQQQNKKNQTTTIGNFSQEQINILSSLPFWISDKKYHEYRYEKSDPKGSCCFNHYVGLPYKHGKRGPLYDYEIND